MTAAILLLVVVLLGGSAGLKVSITPEWEHILFSDRALTVRCVAKAPITHCQFRVSDRDKQKPAVDLSLGHGSNVSHFTYVGDGLLAGHCGATISPEALPAWRREYGSVECRVRNANSSWVYATMSVHRGADRRRHLSIESRLVVVQPGSEVNLLFRTDEPVLRCFVKHPQGYFDLHKRLHCGTKADSMCYYERGMSHEQCGISIKNITDSSSGMYWFRVLFSSTWERTHVQVIVAKPPSTPVLSGNTTINDDGTTNMKAVCTVVGSRPAARITWFLGGEVVTGGTIGYFPDDRWVRQFEDQNNTEQLTLKVDASMNGKDLWCNVNHVALPSPISSNKIKMG